jgi:rhamnosyltransferase
MSSPVPSDNLIKPRVAVLLAAYEGKEFLEEQLFSLKNLTNVDAKIFVSVDGEDNEFHELVKKISEQDPSIFYLKGSVRSSSWENFYRLIMSLDTFRFDFVCLSDQDDFWNFDRVSNAIDKMRQEGCSGYSSNVNAFYKNGKQFVSKSYKMKEFDYMFQSAGPGCTFVLTAGSVKWLQELFCRMPSLLEVTAHDWLIYALFRMNGRKWFYDSNSTLMYRQHDSNVAGANKGLKAKFRRLKLLFSGWYFKDLIIIHSQPAIRSISLNIPQIFQLRRDPFGSVFMFILHFVYYKRVIERTTSK